MSDIRTLADQLWRGEIDTTVHHPVTAFTCAGEEIAALKGFKPQRTNLYAEVGSTFAATVTNRPLECAHVLGTLLRDLGPDYVMWGTDSLLWGNPQWQIDAFRKFQIPDQLVEGHGYPKLTDEIKAKVFGLNAARIWNLKTAASKVLFEPRRIVAV